MACPLPWKRVLRARAAAPSARERVLVARWLEHRGWQQESRQPRWWVDPCTGEPLPLWCAVQVQGLHDAQRVLEGKLWVLARGETDERGRWHGDVELQRDGAPGPLRPLRALQVEGVPTPPAMTRVHYPPVLRVLDGARR